MSEAPRKRRRPASRKRSEPVDSQRGTPDAGVTLARFELLEDPVDGAEERAREKTTARLLISEIERLRSEVALRAAEVFELRRDLSLELTRRALGEALPPAGAGMPMPVPVCGMELDPRTLRARLEAAEARLSALAEERDRLAERLAGTHARAILAEARLSRIQRGLD